jgi:large subunit ribosomal protein L13
MIIDAKDKVVGRIATVAAKKALQGEKIDIINCESALVTGKKRFLLSEAKRRQDMGTFKGPFIYRMPDRYLRRVIRGMLPYKQEKGKKAFKNIMCYIGTPKEFQDKEKTELKDADVSKLDNLNYLSLSTICEKLGWKKAK